MKKLSENTVQKVTNYLRTSDEDNDPTYGGTGDYLADKGILFVYFFYHFSKH